MSWERLHHPPYVPRTDIEVRRCTHPALARSHRDAGRIELLHDGSGFDTRLAEAYDARAGGGGTASEQLVSLVLDALRQQIAQFLDGRADRGNADIEQELDGRAQAITADGVERAALVAACVGAQGHVTGGVVAILRYVGPTEFRGPNGILKLLRDEQNTA